MKEGDVKYPCIAIATISTAMVLVVLTCIQYSLWIEGEQFVWWWIDRLWVPGAVWITFFLTLKFLFR